MSESVLLGGHEDFWKRKSGQDIPFLLLELAVFLRLLKLVFFFIYVNVPGALVHCLGFRKHRNK